MIIDRIVVSASPGEVRIAELSSGNLTNLTLHRDGSESRVGDIYLGRVEAVIHGLQAAFIDIGEARSGFLALPEVRPNRNLEAENDIGDYLNEGDSIVVQVQRDAEEDKGAKLSMHVSLSGRDLVFLPGGRGVSISRRIGDDEVRRRLKTVMDEVSGDSGGGFVVRTAAADAEDEDLSSEVARLCGRWMEIESQRDQVKAPARLFKDIEPACRTLREHGGPALESIIVDDAGVFARMRTFAKAETSDLLEIMTQHVGPEPLFAAQGIDEMIDAALNPRVPLASGGNIVISETPALTAIDVNTGGADLGNRENTALEVNKEAGREIARQVRLRNLSGLLVVDFISMRRHDNQRTLYESFRQDLATDPMHSNLIGFTKLGLAEMTRRRQGGSLLELICEAPAEPVLSPESTALDALRGVLREAETSRAPVYLIEAHGDVTTILENQHAAACNETRERLGGNLELSTVEGMARDLFQIRLGSGGGSS